MSYRIKNISYGEASINAVLSTSEVCSCIAVAILLDDSRNYLFHIDSSKFNLKGNNNMQHEVQNVIKQSILMFSQCKNKRDSSFKSIFIDLGGLNNPAYKSFNDEQNRMLVGSDIGFLHLGFDQLQFFLKCIEYSNTTTNLDDGDIDKLKGLVLISDITILSYQTVSSPVFFFGQYYDYEINLRDGIRTMKPQILFMYNFNNKSWSITDIELSTLISNYLNVILSEFNYNFLSGYDLEKRKYRLMNYISKIKH
ncbi:unnamed protein product [Rotaria socialis]|uniref:Uncharacterized protein n=1 Tax=Rotaria socialis TaxID=392032 RepID=A0A817X5C0_9BILA|nr:unnamed protein product [Rotaria socialis]CAF3650923.1 unnamed protein product [Rotaria socialis]